MTPVLTKILLSNATDIAHPTRRKQVPRVGVHPRRRKRSWVQDGRIGKTRESGFVLLQMIVVYGEL